jgi:aminomethyltransferase
LRDDGGIFADVFVVSLGDWFLVLAEGPAEAVLVAWLSSLRDRVAAKDVSVRGLSDEWTVLGVDGPYAWEIVSGLLGPAVLGMPYLTILARDETICVRAGKTGEYGYLLLVPRSSVDEVEKKLLAIGAPLDLAPVGLDALDVCALESWHFTMRTLRETSIASPLTPLELQLQWRVGYTRDFVGADAVRARKAEGAKARVTCFTAEGPVLPGQCVRLGDLELGEVLAACTSPTLGLTVGSALITRRFAHPYLSLSAMAPAGSGSRAGTPSTCGARAGPRVPSPRGSDRDARSVG